MEHPCPHPQAYCGSWSSRLVFAYYLSDNTRMGSLISAGSPFVYHCIKGTEQRKWAAASRQQHLGRLDRASQGRRLPHVCLPVFERVSERVTGGGVCVLSHVYNRSFGFSCQCLSFHSYHCAILISPRPLAHPPRPHHTPSPPALQS